VCSFPGKAVGVSVGGGAASPAAAGAGPAKPAPAAKAAAGSDSDEELDLFGDATPEEQAAAAERAKVVAAAKARSAEKALLSKSMIVLDVKPWVRAPLCMPRRRAFRLLALTHALSPVLPKDDEVRAPKIAIAARLRIMT
jgi:hypothetical protein